MKRIIGQLVIFILVIGFTLPAMGETFKSEDIEIDVEVSFRNTKLVTS